MMMIAIETLVQVAAMMTIRIFNLPAGAQAQIARELGLSRQAVSKVLLGRFRNSKVIQMAEAIAATHSVKVRAAELRKHLAGLSDEDLLALHESLLATSLPSQP